MRIAGRETRTIWRDETDGQVRIIDQTLLPDAYEIRVLEDLETAAEAIEVMRVRGAPLIGATAAWGIALAMEAEASDEALEGAVYRLLQTRPTAINLRWALDRMTGVLRATPLSERADRASREAESICDEDVATCESIGEHGRGVVDEIVAARARAGRPVDSANPLRFLTHCNAGWLATVDWGTALSPIYKAHAAGIPVHVWVDETRPRNQGASLTALELREMEIPHAVIVDNAGGHLMQHGEVDLVLVGSDRTTATGDVCNKIGTYLKALAAHDNGIPFYVALPVSTIDWRLSDGRSEIPIEERDGEEVRVLAGLAPDGTRSSVRILPEDGSVANPAFDVTPARLVTGLITERGIREASREGLADLSPHMS